MKNFRAIHTPHILVAASVILFSFQAHAQSQSSCATSADCGRGFSCEVIGGTACAGVACPDGQPCPAPPPCEPQTLLGCVPSTSCTADTDCAEGMICHAEMASTCIEPAIACAPDQNCVLPAPNCTSTVVNRCMPKYALECKLAADCGEGFDCVPEQMCTCSGGPGTAPPAGTTPPAGAGGSAGSGATPPPSGADAAPAPPVGTSTGTAVPPTGTSMPTDPGCTCTAGPTSICQPKDLPCATSANCPSTWSCTLVGGYSTCDTSPAPAPDSPFPVAPTTCTSVAGELKCVPPYYETYGGSIGNTSVLGPAAPRSGGTKGTTRAPATVTGMPTGGSTASSDTASPIAPSAPATMPVDPQGMTQSADGQNVSGCSLGFSSVPTSGTLFSGLLAIVGLLVGRRRRQS